MRGEEKQEQKKSNKREERKKKGGGIGDREQITDPGASGVKEELHTQPITKSDTAQQLLREGPRFGKTAAEGAETRHGFPAQQLPPLRTSTGMVLPPEQAECKARLKHESREQKLMRNEMREKDEVEEEESIEDEEISSSHSSSEVGTPSTSTPLKAVPPCSSTNGRQEPPLPAPLSSSLSAIVDPLSSITESRMKTRESGGREVRDGGTVGGGGFVMMGGGEERVGSSEDGDSVSVTVTEMSDEEEEDTMFEETLPQYTTGVGA